MFSDKLKKINQNDWTQERIIVITSHKIFNIHKNKVKRAMDISHVEGFAKNMQGKKPEFSILLPSQYDYRFRSDK